MTHADLPLAIHASYADLLEQLRADVLGDFPPGSTFRVRAISGKRYWYVQEPTTPSGRARERYLGPDSGDLSRQVESGRRAHKDAAARRAIVKSLVAAGLPAADVVTGSVLDAFARAGVFRLRCVVVGSVAFSTYAGHLGIKLSAQSIRTGDLDLAQDYGISLKLDDALDQPILDILKTVDPEFAPVPRLRGRAFQASFVRPGGYRVDIVTTNRGGERSTPVRLPALQTDATPLRFLDFLLRDPIDTAVLHRSGVLIRVPNPARFAVHKLLLSSRRGREVPKSRKDHLQGEVLILALAGRDPDGLATAWREARRRGPIWRRLLDASRKRLTAPAQAILDEA
jgi:hypothetical protein